MSASVLNILIKALALILAVLLWFYVIAQKDYEKELTLPVTEIDFPENLGLVSGMPDSLTVKVFAEGRKLFGSTWKRAGLRLKATRLRRGLNNLDLNLETVSLVRSEDVTLLELVGPASAQVHLDRIDSTFKPVASRLALVLADGYAAVAGTEIVDPKSIMITGPTYLLGRVDSIYTEQKILDNVKKPVEIFLKFDIPDSLSLTPAEDSVLVKVIVDEIITRKFEDFALTVRNNRRSNRVIIDPEKASLEISGPKIIIDSLTAEDIRLWVTPTITEGDQRVTPEIELPANVSLKRIEPDSIRVLVEK